MAKNEDSLESSLSALQHAEAELQSLRKQVTRERRDRLKRLHLSLGFASRAELLEALETKTAARRNSGGTPVAAKSAPKGKRARITAETRAAIVKALRRGESGPAVAARYGVSNPTVYNIKKAAGLVKPRG